MRSSLIWVCTVCSDLSVPIFKIITVLSLLNLFFTEAQLSSVEEKFKQKRQSHRSRRANNKSKNNAYTNSEEIGEGMESPADSPLPTSTADSSFKPVVRPFDKKILMVETKIVNHEPFTYDLELKVSNSWLVIQYIQGHDQGKISGK